MLLSKIEINSSDFNCKKLDNPNVINIGLLRVRHVGL
jgi:hypothetical protein